MVIQRLIPFTITNRLYNVLFFLFIIFLFSPNQTYSAGFSCDTGTLSDTCTVSTLKSIDAGDTITGSGSIVIANGGELRVATSSSISISVNGDITIQSGGKITGNLSNVIATNFTIDSGGLIDVSAKGYVGSSTNIGTTCVGCGGAGGYGTSGGFPYGGGGAYGGNGSPSITNATNIVSLGGTAYGSTTAPSNFGSGGGGGGYNYPGGNGGGLIRINISGTLTNNGQILANGQSGFGTSYTALPGAGSGGSIWLTAGTLSGTGTTSANGGNGHVYNVNGYGGSGGGGRIALYYTTNNSTQVITAKGGGSSGTSPKTFAGAGTIYKKQASWIKGDLTIDNGNYGTIEYSTTPIIDSLLNLGTTTVKNLANLTFASSTNITFNSGDMYLNSGNITFPTTSVQTILNGQNLYISSGTSTINVLATTTNPPVFTNINILSGGILSHATTANAYSLFLNANNLTVNSGGIIDASARGYAGGITTAGVTCNGCGGGGGYILGAGAGGGHGGTGANSKYSASSATGGSSYGSATNPITYGSGGGGGGSTYAGGTGGGVIKLFISNLLTNNGIIKSNGGNGTGTNYPYMGGGGAGGSIWIQTGTLACGSGSVTANGGNGYYRDTSYYAGGGGGGRLYMLYSSGSACSTFTANAGTASSTYGLAQVGTLSSIVSPELSTSPASSITNSGAVFNGSIDSTGGLNAIARGFEYGLTTSYTASTSESGSFNTGNFSASVSGLNCNTLYHFRSYANNPAGIGFGADNTFTTGACVPSIDTDSASSVGTSTVTLNGTISSTGGADIIERGFGYGLNTSYTSSTTENGTFGTGQYSLVLSNLIPDTTYHFRAYAVNSAGITYGADQQFITTLNTPVISTNTATNITQTSIVLNGTVGDTGGNDILYRGFEYGLTDQYGATSTENGTFSTGDFYSSISNLVCNTTYHFRAYASNQYATGYGTDISFTTQSCSSNNITGTRIRKPSAQIYMPKYDKGLVNNIINLQIPTQTLQQVSPEILFAQQQIQKIQEEEALKANTTTSLFLRDLKLGMFGEDVRNLQRRLNKLGYTVSSSGLGSMGQETNFFGRGTFDAVMKFQRASKLPITGFFGPMTRKIMNGMN